MLCEPPYTERYAQWCERTVDKLIIYLLLDPNTARGPEIDQKALISVLKEKRIAGAALDVYENEPSIPQGLKLFDNVVLTPHLGTDTYETDLRMVKEAQIM